MNTASLKLFPIHGIGLPLITSVNLLTWDQIVLYQQQRISKDIKIKKDIEKLEIR